METQNFTPEKEVIEMDLLAAMMEKIAAEDRVDHPTITMQEMLDDYNKEIPAIEEPEKKDVPTVH